jgi:hypothetical protein
MPVGLEVAGVVPSVEEPIVQLAVPLVEELSATAVVGAVALD